jgi:HK97 family phage portal protein
VVERWNVEGDSMSWMQRAALWLGQKATAYGSVSVDTTSPKMAHFVGGQPTITGKVINDDTMMRITTAYACVRIIAETIGCVTLDIFERKENGNAEKVKDHDLGEILINGPNSEMTGMVYRECMGTNLAARGNAYSLIERRSKGQVSSLFPFPASRVSVRKDSTTGWEVKYGVDDRGKTEWYPSEKIWHWKGFGYNGLMGLSPLQSAREALGLAIAGEEAEARLFANGLSASAILSIPQFLKPEQRKQADEILAGMHAGLTNFGKPYLLEGGMKVEDGIFAPRDAQFLELRRFQISELCRLWRISPHMIADLERATNNNIEQLSLEFAMYTMLPYYRRIEEEARQLFIPGDKRKYFVRFNYESLLRADSAARAALYNIMLQNGVLTRNEVRALENRNSEKTKGMDDFTVQLNMVPIDKLEEAQKAKVPPPAPAADPNADPNDPANIDPNKPKPKPKPPADDNTDKAVINVGLQGIEDLAGYVKQAVETVQTQSAMVARLVDALDAHGAAAEVLSKQAARVDALNTSTRSEIASSLSEGQAKMAEAIVALAESLKESAERSERAAALASRPRKVITDDSGNPIGTMPVDTLQ